MSQVSILFEEIEILGLPWPVFAMVALSIGTAVAGIYRLISRKRQPRDQLAVIEEGDVTQAIRDSNGIIIQTPNSPRATQGRSPLKTVPLESRSKLPTWGTPLPHYSPPPIPSSPIMYHY